MYKKLIEREAVVGLNIELDLSDVIAIANMRDNLQAAINEYRAIDAYNKLPYDQRKDMEKPTEELYKALPTSIDKVIVLLKKLSVELPKSDIFNE